MPKTMENLIEQYVEAVKKIYGSHIRQTILYGSYARGDLVLYRLETTKNNLKSARALFAIIASKEESERQILTADEFIILAEKYCREQMEELGLN